MLRPGGHFLYADFRFSDGAITGGFAEWEASLAAAPLTRVQSREINAEVRRGMERNGARSEALIQQHLPKWLHALGRDFAGIPGSRVHTALARGELSYRSFCFVKPAPSGRG